jgi:hypothetical protein
MWLLCISSYTGCAQSLSLRSRTGGLLRRWRPRLSTDSTATNPTATTKSVPYSYDKVFPQQTTPYVPEGMTAAEYAAMKQREATDAATKNFGAWGPRFRPDAKPAGDWLLLPRLWTRGVPENSSAPSGDPPQRSRRQVLGRWAAAVWCSYISVNVVLAAIQLAYAGQLTARQALWRGMGLLLRGKQFLVQAYWVALATKLGVVAALTWPAQRALDTWEERCQWSRLRLIVTSTTLSLIALMAYALLIVGLRRTFL